MKLPHPAPILDRKRSAAPAVWAMLACAALGPAVASAQRRIVSQPPAPQRAGLRQGQPASPVGGVVGPGAPGPLFAESQAFVPGDLRSLVGADLDADGDVDVAVLSSQVPGVVSVFANDGDATFAPPVELALGNSPIWMTSGDLDGDGAVDLVLATAGYSGNGTPGTVSVLRNLGDGTFVPQATYTAGTTCSRVITADLDGDGDLDVVAGHSFLSSSTVSDEISLLFNLGDGTLAPEVRITVGESWSLRALDVEGDEDVDLAVLLEPSGLLILRNDGSGSFSPEGPFASGTGPIDLAAGDLDGDGDEDLALANDGSSGVGTVSVLRNDGNGTFAAPVVVASTATPQALEIVDLDGDGVLDLSVCTYSGLSVLGNRGEWAFARVDYPAYSASSLVGGFLGSATADLDGDGDVDLALGAPRTTLRILLNDHDRGFELRTPLAAIDEPRSVRMACFDGDGLPDLVVASNSEGTVSLLHNRGDRRFAPAVSFPTGAAGATGSKPWSLVPADLDGDGDLDLGVTHFDSDTVSLLANDGAGGFGPALSYAAGDRPNDLAIGDLDGDGAPDLALINDDGCGVLLNDGLGAFAPPVQYGAGLGSIEYLEVGDLDLDGDLDLAVTDETHGSSQSCLAVLLNRGDGTFGAIQKHGNGNSAYVALADLNADGSLDVAVTQAYGLLLVLRNRGDATFRPQATYPTGPWGRWIEACDLDGDGDPDLAVATSLGDSTLSVLRNDGAGFFSLDPELYGATSVASSLACGDLDGDRDADVVIGSILSSPPGAPVGTSLFAYWNRLRRKPRVIDGIQDPFVIDTRR